MRVLVAILACHSPEDAILRAISRETWLPNLTCDYRFYMGLGSGSYVSDELTLAVPDDYLGLPHKSRALFKWALAKGYDYVFKCDTDTYVCPPRLLSSGFEQHDYSGFYRGQGPSYASGGAYWLSRRAMHVLTKRAPRMITDVGDATRRSRWGEDFQVGNALMGQGIYCHNDDRYEMVDGPQKKNNVISLHLFKSRDKAADLRETHLNYIGEK
jgi:hypothetical protein